MQTISYPSCPPCEVLYGDTGGPYLKPQPHSVIGGICGSFPPLIPLPSRSIVA
jgi:hypothetical protein